MGREPAHLHLDEAFGRSVSLDLHRLQPDDVQALLDGAGFEPTSAASQVPQCFLIARRPLGGA